MKTLLALSFLITQLPIYHLLGATPPEIEVIEDEAPLRKIETMPVNDNKLQFLKEKTSIERPLDLRDPFKRVMTGAMKAEEDANKKMLVNGKFSNLPTIDGLPLEQIKIIAIYIGEERRAMAKLVGSDGKIATQETFILREGMTLGEDKAEIKAILPGGIVLVEKIKNVYDQVEYLETILPISRQ